MNKLAKLSVKACAALGGYSPGELETPVNEMARKIFNRLLTPYLTEQLSNEDPHQVLLLIINLLITLFGKRFELILVVSGYSY